MDRPIASQQLPLSGIRVVEIGMNVAIPTGDRILADMGAQVIKIEAPSHLEGGRVLRSPDDTPTGDYWNKGALFHELNRNKQSLTLDLASPEAREVFFELVKVSDVVTENFTPRVMHNFGLEYPVLRRLKPDLIMLSNSAFGRTGPWGAYKSFGHPMEATVGLSHLTGYKDGPPMRTTLAYADTPVGYLSAFVILAALEHRARTGRGQWIDVSMYQAGVSFIAEAMMDFFMNGRTRERMGNRDPLLAPQGCYPCAGRDRWVAITVEDDEQWASLCHLMGHAGLAEDSRFADPAGRCEHHDELDDIIGAWTSTREHYEVMRALQALGIPAGPVLTNKELLLDPHLAERGFMEWVDHSPELEGLGPRLYPGMPWKMGRFPLHIRRAAPKLGEDNQRVILELLGFPQASFHKMREGRVIADRPARPGPPEVTTAQEFLASGQIWPLESGYQQVLRQRPDGP